MASKECMSSVVKSYMLSANRPYSAVDVINNLNTKDTKVSKTAVVKALEELAANEEIKDKTYGKSKIYFAIQHDITIDDTQVAQIEQQLDQLGRQLTQLRDEVKQKETKITATKSCLTLDEINDESTALKLEIQDMERRLEAMDSNGKAFDPKESQKLKTKRQQLVTEWRKRKRLATNMMDAILESYPKPKKALIEEIGVETDEDLKVCLPNN